MFSCHLPQLGRIFVVVVFERSILSVLFWCLFNHLSSSVLSGLFSQVVLLLLLLLVFPFSPNMFQCFSWLSLQHLGSNWLNFLCTELYNSLSSTFFLWALQIALIQPIHGQGYTLLFLDRVHLLFIRVHFLFWQPGRVVGQYTIDLNNYVFWKVSTRLLISNSPNPFINPVLTVPCAPIATGISVTFFSSLARSTYLCFFSFSFNFTIWSVGTAKFTVRQVFFFLLLSLLLLTISRSGRLAEITWSVFIWISQRSLCVAFFRTNSGLCIYHLSV